MRIEYITTRKMLVILITLIFHIYSYGQNTTIDMYPKTPDAAAASKFVDIPAGNYTGVANFTIPIYTINAGGVTIPIELNYSTNGIKVSEMAGRVGLGWSLNVGASLSQQIYGEPDNPSGFKKYTINTLENTVPYTCDGGSNDNILCYAFLSAIGITVTNGLKVDLLPDIFSYQLLDKSGQFIMDFSGEYGIPRPYNQVKIKPIRGLFGEDIKVIGENGIQYLFKNDPNQLEYFSSCQGGELPINPAFTPLFKIASIEMPNKSIIEYKYSKAINSTFISSISELKNIYNKKSTATAPWYTLPPEKCVNKTHSIENVLTEINFSGGKILFFYNNDQLGYTGTNRQDILGDVYLTRVMVKSLSNQTISDTSLIYDYFLSDSLSDNYPEEADNHPDTFKRLKLTTVRNNLTLTSYKLKYYGDDNGKNLPNRFSFSQDFWGVYNGQPNTTGIATVKVKRWNSQNIYDIYKGANKQPDINFGIIGNLRKIQYPNGGYTEITYEADDYIKNDFVPPIYDYVDRFTYKASLNNPIDFVIPTGNNIYDKEIILYDSDCDENNSEEGMNGDPTWELRRISIDPKVFSGWMCTKTVDRQSDIAASYRLNIVQAGGAKNSRELSAKYHWIEEVIVNDHETRKTGTIRVKQIESNSSDSGNIIRQYTYINPETGKSSGKNAGEELFVALSYNEITIPPQGWGSGSFASQLNRVNNPGWQTNTVRGKAVGYDYVQEIFTSSLNPSTNFKKEQKFKNDILQYHAYDYMSPVNIDWPTLDLDRGLMLEEMSFDDEGNRIRHVKCDYGNDYYFNQFASMNFFGYPTNVSTPFIAQAAVIKQKTYSQGPAGDRTYHLNLNLFDINNMWIKSVKTTTTDYVNNQPTLVTEQTTAYTNPPQHTFPEIQSSTIVGSGITTSQQFKYAHDLNSYLKESNIISIPLETEVKKNNVLISKTQVNYPNSQEQADVKTSGLPLPYEVLSKNLLGDMERQISYNQYDNKGNLQQYTTKAGVSTAIIWGYHQTQPIAKIEGATYAQVSGNISDIINYSNTDDAQGTPLSEQDLIDQLDLFRKSFPDFQITTYTYDSLIGVRSVTPPSGIREIYSYDAANRLQSVKDINGNILKEYDYNYKP